MHTRPDCHRFIASLSALALIVALHIHMQRAVLVHAAAENTSPSGPSLSPNIIPLDIELRFERLSLEHGLSQNGVLSVYQDSEGFIWIGTQDGLNRYDGYHFTVYKHDPSDSGSLSSSSIISMLEDSRGGMWIGTWGAGLNYYDRRTGIFTHYQHNPEQPGSLAHDIVAAIYEDRMGRLWFGTMGGGLDLFDRERQTFKHYSVESPAVEQLSSNFISKILEDSSGRLWLGTGGYGIPGKGLIGLDPDAGQFAQYQQDPANPASISGDSISALAFDKAGFLWVGTGGYGVAGAGLNRLNLDTGIAERFQHDPAQMGSISSNDVQSLMVDTTGMLWVGTWGGGLNRLDPSQERPYFYRYSHDTYNPQSLSSDIVWSMFEDRSGVIWVGTINGGLNVINPDAQRFMLYRNHPNKPDGLGFNVIGPILQTDNGNIWLGLVGGGIDILDPLSGKFTHLAADPNNPTSLPDNKILALFKDRSGGIWVGTERGIAAWDPRQRRFTRMQHDPLNSGSLVDNHVTSIVEDWRGRLWIATMGGLDVYNRQNGNFSHVELPGAQVFTQLFLDRRGQLWVGTWGQGLFVVDPNSLHESRVQYTQYSHNPQDGDSISDNVVWSFRESHNGVLWIGTGRGINRFDSNNQEFQSYTESDGMANNAVLCILEDHNELLWIATNDGLSRFDPKQELFKNYDASDGLQSDEFNSNACIQAVSGLMYFGGNRGLSVFDPDQIRDNPVSPKIVITTFRVFNEPVPIDPNSSVPIQLSYSQNFIAFEFVALDYHAPQKNQYAYKLEGFDDDWVYAGNRRYASYTNLLGGDYTFRVRASNNDGVWNDDGIAIPIHVTPPFWSTWWFQVGSGVTIATLLLVGLRLRLEGIRDRNRQLEDLVGKRTVDLRQANLQLESEIVQRKRAEQALAQRASEELQQSEARFRAMFNDAAVGIGLMTLDRKIIEANAAMCHMLRLSFDEIIGANVEEMIYPEDRQVDAEYYNQMAIGVRDAFSVEKRYVRKSGEAFWARLTLSMVRDLYGVPKFMVGMVEDIDEQKRAVERLAAQEREYLEMLERRVTERTNELLQSNQRLQHEIEQRQRVEQALAQKAIDEAVALERTRLAHELHDAVTQTLFSASLIAEVLPELWNMNPAEGERSTQELRQLTRGALAEMRTLLLELRPAVLTQTSFEDLLRQLAEALIGRGRLPIDLKVNGKRRLPPEVQVALYRITQESLNNIQKYARANRAWIEVNMTPGGVYLCIRDDGVGFDPGQSKPGSMGLRIMRERAESIDAELEIFSKPGYGTRVTVIWNELQLDQEAV